MSSILTKPGQWYVNRKKYDPKKTMSPPRKIFDQLCDKDKAMILEKTRSNDIKAMSFIIWATFAASLYLIFFTLGYLVVY